MHRGCFVWTPTPPLAGRRTPRPGPVRVCVCSPPGRVGRAGLPGAFWCASPFPFAAWSFCFAGPPPGWGCPLCGSLVSSAPPPPFFFFLLSLFRAPLVSFFLWFPAPGALGLGALFVFSPPSRLVFFFSLAPPLSPAFFGFRPGVPWALALCAVCFVGLPLPGSPRALASFVVPAPPVAVPRWLLPVAPPPPPFLCLAVSVCSHRIVRSSGSHCRVS